MYQERVNEFMDKIGLCYDIVKYGFHKIVDGKKWNSVFIESRDSILKTLEADEYDNITAIKLLFNDASIKKLAEILERCNGFDLHVELKKAIDILLNENNISKVNVAYIKQIFSDAVIYNLKNKYPDIYRDIKLNEFIVNTEKNFTNIITNLNEKELAVYNIWQIDKYIKEKNDYGIGLDFFDFNEQVQDNNILEGIKKNNIVYIKSLDSEEALYYVLRLLKNQVDLCDNVLLINDSDTWNSMKNKLQGNIVVPLFCASNIDPMPGCKTVYTVSSDYPLYNKFVIKIINRTKSNLYHKLEEYVHDSVKLDFLLNENACLFSILKKRLFHGDFSQPHWLEKLDNDTSHALVVSLLLGAWSNSNQKNDSSIIVKLFGEDINKFHLIIKPFFMGETPFIIKIPKYSYTEYRVADLSFAWGYLVHYLDSNLIESFKDVAKTVLLDVSNKLEYGIMSVDCGCYSIALKQGILKSLIFLNLFGNFEYNDIFRSRKISSEIVKDLLSRDLSEEEWNNIAEIMPELVEAAPVEFIELIEKHISDAQSGIWAIFKNRGNEPYTYPQYPRLLSALEKTLFFHDTRVRSIKVLEKLLSRRFDHKIVNSPLHTLSNVFCGFFDELDLGVQARKELLYNFSERDSENCWLLTRNILPQGIGGTYDYLSKPKYIPFDYNRTQLNTNVIIENYKVFFEIAFKCAGNDLNKWGSFLESGVFIAYNYKDIVMKNIKLLINQTDFTDRYKYDFSSIIRKFIYDNRYYRNRSYIKEDVLKEFEQLYNSITYKCYLYSKLYIFEDDYKPLYPGVFEEKNFSEHLETHIAEQEGLQIEVWNTLARGELLAFFDLLGDPRLAGVSMAKAFGKKIDRDIVISLYSKKKINMLSNYLYTICNELDVLGIKWLLDNVLNDCELEIRYMVLVSKSICEEFLELLENLSLEEQNYYWSRVNPFFKEESIEVVQKCFKKLIANDNFTAALFITKYRTLQLDDYIYFLAYYSSSDNKSSVQKCSMYDIRNIFKNIYSFGNKADDHKEEIITYEILFIRAFNNLDTKLKPQYLYEKIYEAPEFCAEIIKLTYKSDDGESLLLSKNEELLGSFYNYILDYIHFCPGVDVNSNYSPDKIRSWVEKYVEVTTLNNQTRIGYSVLGKLFSYFPRGLFDTWLPYEICEVIELINDDSLKASFICQSYNNRGVHYSSNGSESIPYYEEYMKYSKAIENQFPITSCMLLKVANEFKEEVEERRERAIHEYF